ncbi:TauD/TfdA family dioxygenase [Streptomyces dangxiongensis]|uniref:TauD/TfdA family dioxygenase n=1 Tax=Streptomyces dangxiongensis TaxID=1442032 RepID=UPI0013CF09FA|nr:TauD/TfdA family dioxygenase [Streptomyces dangxiongensis]
MAPPVTVSERREIARLLFESARDLGRAGVVADDFLKPMRPHVPEDVLAALRPHLRQPDRRTGVSTIPGLLAEFDGMEPTPVRWGLPQTERTRTLDLALTVVAFALGEPFAWAGQQEGRLVHDIVPTPGSEDKQVGASSLTTLEWHTEDSFHPERAQALMLYCVRNPDGVGSRVSSIRDTGLSEERLDILRRPEVVILPDDSYPATWKGRDCGTGQGGVRTVWDAEDGPCVRYDPAYSRFLTDDPDFHEAYRALGEALEKSSVTVGIEPGDILLIDNDLAVHGRAPFRPSYDGTDRWLKRLQLRLPRPRPATEAAETGYGQRPLNVGAPGTVAAPGTTGTV